MGDSYKGQGLEVHAELSTTDASTPLPLPITEQATNATVSIGVTDFLSLVAAQLYIVATGAAALFFDSAALASAVAIVAATDGGAGEDSITIAGDRAAEFAAGRVFTVANSTANDGSYTSTGATYNATTGQTTITIATASLTDETGDGDITSTPLARAGSTIWSGTVTTNTFISLVWDSERNGRRGRAGERLYASGAAGQFDVHVDALRRKELAHTVPAEPGTQIM